MFESRLHWPVTLDTPDSKKALLSSLTLFIAGGIIPVWGRSSNLEKKWEVMLIIIYIIFTWDVIRGPGQETGLGRSLIKEFPSHPSPPTPQLSDERSDSVKYDMFLLSVNSLLLSPLTIHWRLSLISFPSTSPRLRSLSYHHQDGGVRWTIKERMFLVISLSLGSSIFLFTHNNVFI